MLSNEVVPATVKLSDNVVPPVTPNVPPMIVLFRFKSFVTVKLVTVVLSNVVVPDTVKEPATVALSEMWLLLLHPVRH